MATRLVRLAGSSAYFDRSIIAYSKEAKIQSLDMDPTVFERFGSVSLETACAMAEGLRRLSQADLVLAETGIAGPNSWSLTEAARYDFVLRYLHRTGNIT